MTRRRTARGFTLLEMLIVLGIIVFLTSITVVVALRMQERDQVSRAATVIQGALAQAKARAAAERTNVGIRLVLRLNKGELFNNPVDTDGDGVITLIDMNNPANTPSRVQDANGNGIIDYEDIAFYPPAQGGYRNGVDEDQNSWPDDLVLCDAVEFIRDPGDFTDGAVMTGIRWQGSPLQPGLEMNWLFLSRSLPALDLQDLSNFVQPGDRIELLGLGQIYRIIQVDRYDDPNDSPDMGAYNRIILDRPLEVPVSPFGPARTAYRIIRQPQVIQGEKPLALPTGAVLDLRLTQLGSRLDKYEILFSPGGRVVGTSAAQDMIFLWVHDAASGIIDNQVLVTVYPKTGATFVFPVNIDAYLTGTGDLYAYARLGRAANTP